MKTSMLTLAMWCAMTTAMAQTYQVPVSEAHEQMLAGKWWEGYDPQKLYAQNHRGAGSQPPPTLQQDSPRA